MAGTLRHDSSAGALSSGAVSAPSVMQVTSLPSPALQQIVKRVAGMGMSHLQNLRMCSRSWRLICYAEATSFQCDSDTLIAAVHCASSLPQLHNLTIKRNKDKSCTLTQGVLSSLQGLQLQILTLKGPRNVGSANHKMVVEDCRNLLLPWSQFLQCIHLIRCCLPRGVHGRRFAGHAYFSKFPQLTSLKLHSIRAEPPFTSLDLRGCSKLCKLDCYHGQLSNLLLNGCKRLSTLSLRRNRVCTLDLSDCVNLESLCCESNRLGALDISACTKLTHLACSSNRLVNLDLTSCTRLWELDCTHNKQLQSLQLREAACFQEVNIEGSAKGRKLFCNVSIDTLHCDSGLINFIPPKMRAQLRFLTLEDEVLAQVAGFVKLAFLWCTIGTTGLVDLTGCADIFLNIGSSPNGLLLSGRSAVDTLTLWGRVKLLDLQGFTSLTELHISALQYEDTHLDLSVIPCVIKVRIGHEEEIIDCAVSSINLSGCSCLKELHIEFMKGLMDLDLSSCVSLTTLTCFGNGLPQLDVSCCSSLTSLDIDYSKQLKSLTINGSFSLKKFCSKDCPQLSIEYRYL